MGTGSRYRCALPRSGTRATGRGATGGPGGRPKVVWHRALRLARGPEPRLPPQPRRRLGAFGGDRRPGPPVRVQVRGDRAQRPAAQVAGDQGAVHDDLAERRVVRVPSASTPAGDSALIVKADMTAFRRG